MKKTFSIRTMAEVAIFAALGYVLDFLAGAYSAPLFVNGGSIGIAMVCVYIVAYRRGFFPALLVGLIMGLLDLADGFYSIADVWYKAFAQVALDYVVAYPLVAFAGLFKGMFDRSSNNKGKILAIVYGCTLGGILKLLSHVLSGVLFWSNDFQPTWGISSPLLFSFVYNGAYMVPCIVLSMAIVIFIAYKYSEFLTEPDSYSLRVSNNNKGDK
ncbi:MAG: energy-coupled thiamine transporter ThiT [Bacilli bacterium]